MGTKDRLRPEKHTPKGGHHSIVNCNVKITSTTLYIAHHFLASLEVVA